MLQQAAENPGQAASLYKNWIALNDLHPGVHAIMFNYAVTLADAGDLAGAAFVLRAVIARVPGFAPAYINLGGVLERLGQRDRAVAIWSELANAPAPFNGENLNYKVLALKQMGRVLEAANADSAAEQALRQSLELNPEQPDAIQHLLALRQRQCAWPVLAGTERLPVRKLVAGVSPLSAGCLTDDPMFQLANAAHYCRASIGMPPVPPDMGPPDRTPIDLHGADTARPHAVARGASGRRPRIGYVSSDLRDHAVGFAMTDVVETHDRERFEIFAYDCGIATADNTRARIKAAAEHWTDLNPMDDVQAYETIRRDGIDILVDLNGYTKDARTKVFAMRPAPIAVNWFGFPGTMGSPYHHYLLADEHIVPASHARYYTETVLHLPCYQPNDRKRPVGAAPTRAQAGLPEDAFVFCCLNGMQKITAATFQRWSIVLRHVPDSVLWLLSGTDEANALLRNRAAALGIAPERLIFAEKRANPDHLARYPLADLFLDTFPYGAHTTAADSLWMGVPVLTLRGRGFAARVCASLVHAAGLPELVATSANDYVVRAIGLANDRPRLRELRERLIAGRDTCTLFDTPRLVRALEARYAEMLRAPIPVPDLRNLDIYREAAMDNDLPGMELLDDAAYAEHYRTKLATIDAVFPVAPDNRLWSPLTAPEYSRSALG